MNKKIKGVNIVPDEVLDLLLEKTQREIDALVAKQLTIEPELEKAKAIFEEAVGRFREDYQKVQDIWDEQQAKIDVELNTKQYLLRQKSMGTYQEEQDIDWRKKSRRTPKHRVLWAERIREILKASGKFSEHIFLINKIALDEIENHNQTISKSDKSKSASYVKSLALKRVQGLAWYDGLVGLDEWMDGDQPKQEFLKYKQLQNT